MGGDNEKRQIEDLLAEAKYIQRSFASAGDTEKATLSSRYREIDQRITDLKRSQQSKERRLSE